MWSIFVARHGAKDASVDWYCLVGSGLQEHISYFQNNWYKKPSARDCSELPKLLQQTLATPPPQKKKTT